MMRAGSRPPPPRADPIVREPRSDFGAKVRPSRGSVNFHHLKAGFVCAVLPQASKVLLAFEHGRLLDSPLLVDSGKSKQVRWIPPEPGGDIPVDDIGILLSEAIALRS